MNRIEFLRKKINLSQLDFAIAVGVTQGAVSQWESGISKPSYDKIPEIAKALHCTIDELFAENKTA